MKTIRIHAVVATAAAAFALLLAVAVPTARAQDEIPDELAGIDITPTLGTEVPLDGVFTDQRGKEIHLRDYFAKDRPVVLVLAYYQCPMLCTLVLQAAADGLKEISLDAGEEFDIVVISIDPTETAQLAKLNQQKFIQRYGRPGAGRGIHFLVGREPEIRRVADAVGFHYRKNEENGQYMHAAGIFILTPSGKLSQCITGVQYEPNTLKLSLLDASEGKQGSILDKILLWCHTYDPEAGTYSVTAMNVMRVAGVILLLAVGALVVPVWLRSFLAKDEKDEDAKEQSE